MSENTNTVLNHLFIKNFRNLSEASLDFSPNHNLFIGPNGHGKTNCLEAISLVTSLRPMQMLQNIDLINKEQSQSKLLARFEALNFSLELDIFKAGKRAKINDQPIKSANNITKDISLVSFIPSELNMHASQSLRRRALDQAAANFYFEHSLSLRAYEKILQSRNRMLKEGISDRETFEAFTALLLDHGAKIMFFRLKALENIQEDFVQVVRDILGENNESELSYWQKEQLLKNYTLMDLKANLASQYGLLGKEEIRRKATLFGPHLDDVLFSLNGMDAKKHGSRGQCRTLVLALKLAQMIGIRRLKNQAPVIILDDIVSELDVERKKNLVEVINKIQAQAFFSATDLENFGEIASNTKVFHLCHGSVA
jgi:DNA replication and repair protein RecF